MAHPFKKQTRKGRAPSIGKLRVLHPRLVYVKSAIFFARLARLLGRGGGFYGKGKKALCTLLHRERLADNVAVRCGRSRFSISRVCDHIERIQLNPRHISSFWPRRGERWH